MSRNILASEPSSNNEHPGRHSLDAISNPPQSVAGYQLLEKVGQGTLTAVYRARSGAGRIVAIKLLRADAARDRVRLMRFYHGAKLAMRVNHPAVVETLEVGCDQGWHFVVMGYVEGGNLAAYVRKMYKIHERRALEMIVRLADGLDAIHDAGIIHRDVNPANILLTRSGEVMLADLGLSKSSEEDYNLTVLGNGLGTPHYMAPEQFRGAKRVGRQADVYSLGATLYTLVTGKLPFRGQTVAEQLVTKIKNDYIPPERFSPALSCATISLINKAMHADPGRRPETAAAFAGLARRCLELLDAEERGDAFADAADLSEPLWHVVFLSASGRRARLIITENQVLDLVRKGRLPSDARASLGGTQPFLPLAQIEAFRRRLFFAQSEDADPRYKPAKEKGQGALRARLVDHLGTLRERWGEGARIEGRLALLPSLVVGALCGGIGFGSVIFLLQRVFGSEG